MINKFLHAVIFRKWKTISTVASLFPANFCSQHRGASLSSQMRRTVVSAKVQNITQSPQKLIWSQKSIKDSLFIPYIGRGWGRSLVTPGLVYALALHCLSRAWTKWQKCPILAKNLLYILNFWNLIPNFSIKRYRLSGNSNQITGQNTDGAPVIFIINSKLSKTTFSIFLREIH